MGREQIKPFFIALLFCAAGAVVIGFLLFQQRIFPAGRGVFQFLSFGIIGSAILSGFRYLNRWIAVVIGLILVILNEILLTIVSLRTWSPFREPLPADNSE